MQRDRTNTPTTKMHLQARTPATQVLHVVSDGVNIGTTIANLGTLLVSTTLLRSRCALQYVGLLQGQAVGQGG